MNNQDARFLDLLQKWQSGDFTRSDEREMDALTQGDPFRREAWEGFSAQADAEHDHHLHALRTRLRKRAGLGQTRRIIPFPMLLSAAAALVLLVAAVVFFGKNGRQPDATLTDIVATPTSPDQPSPTTAPSDNVPPTSAYTFAANDESRTESKSSPTNGTITPGRAAAAPPPVADDAAASPSPVEIASEERAESDFAKDSRAASPSTVATVPVDVKSEQITGGAADKMSEPVATESVKKKSAAPSVAKPIPTAPLPSKLDTAWNKTGTPPDMAKRRKEAREAEQPAQSEPSTGWEAFQDYLRQTARLTPAARTKGVSGTVRLQFTVSENGDPQGFLTLRSVGYGCDQEAIRLVKDWVWVRGQNPVVTVEIPFVR